MFKFRHWGGVENTWR